MSIEANQEAVTPLAPAISADFLTGSTEIGLERIRTRLLDLTNKNKLLNFKHTPASSIRIVDVELDAVFKLLKDYQGENYQKLRFMPVPKPEGSALRAGLQAKDHADSLGWNTSFDLPGETDERADTLPVLLYHEQLNTVSRKLYSAAKTAIEESGANMLFLVFGFLEWFESDDSDQSHIAPLVMLPVTLQRTGGKASVVEAVLQYSGEDIETNLSLVEKMRRDFSIEIPRLEDEDTPDSYLAKFVPVLEQQKRWAVKRHITLALLSFGKMLMYRDLDPKTWPKAESIVTHRLVRQLFEGNKNPSVEHAEEFAIDEPELAKDVPQLIRDADSSQHSALIDALQGQNLVIEGPPGTGKSQTITNLIAATLAKGKTVLFVAEKLAALQVVRSRLDSVGLGIFCLELHSHKTQKGALLKDLDQRYNLRGSFKDPHDLDTQLELVKENKARLIKYAKLVNRTIESFGATVFEILWAFERSAQDVADLKPMLAKVTLPDVLKSTRADFKKAEQFLDEYAQHLATVHAPGRPIDGHPWAWLNTPLQFNAQDKIIALLDELVSVKADCEKQCDLLQNQAGVSLNRTPSGIELAASKSELLPTAEGVILAELLQSCQSRENRENLEAFCGHVDEFHAAFDKVSAVSENACALLDPVITEKLPAACDCLAGWGLENLSLTKIKQLLATSADTTKLLGEAGSCLRMLSAAIGCDAEATLSGATFLLEAARIIDSAPFDQMHLRLPTFEQEQAIPILQTAQREASTLRQEELTLGQQFDLTNPDVQKPEQLLLHAAAVEEASWWGRVFGADYRKGLTAYRRLCRTDAKATPAEMAAALRSVAHYARSRSRFNENNTYRSTFGAHFRGVESPWEDLRTVILWYEETFGALPTHQPIADRFRRLIFTARVEQLKAIRANLAKNKEDLDLLQQVVSRINEFIKAVPSKRSLMLSGSFDQISQAISSFCQEGGAAVAALERASIMGVLAARDVQTTLPLVTRCRHEHAEINNDAKARTLLGLLHADIHTDTRPIRTTVQFAHAIVAAKFPPPTIEWLLNKDYAARLGNLRTWLNGVQGCAVRLRSLADEIATISKASSWNNLVVNSWESLLTRAQDSLSHRDELAQWNDFLDRRIKSKDRGLDRLTALADSGDLPPTDLTAGFRFAFYNSLARGLFTEDPELSLLSGLTQEQLQKEFASADREAIRLYSERVAALIDKRPIPAGSKGGRIRDWTEMAIIHHEIHKQKKHIAIRDLIKRSANALVALKPCFMMGPLSVAQYLAPGQLKFDLVVMDEASQLKPEDAIGALARAGQMVVVGDPKQLPPTSFFQKVNLEAEDEPASENYTAVEEGESILDVASTLYQPVRRLRWHYRSRHHSLIAFSNKEFYGGDLVIFPSAQHEHPSLGVKHRHIPNGVFDNGRNAPEAEAVVAAALEHMREHSDESLGIVTLNFEQRELVEELLDKQLRDDPHAVSYQEHMIGGQESLFIKNLENVQGDERDVIFISTTYGPDMKGNLFQHFGPINGAQGHRRLNVLFTRSKKRIVVFSSLDPDMIQIGKDSSRGLRALKNYLRFARDGVLEQPDNGLEQATNDFERSVGAVLKENGYDVVSQVGVAGFFIDLAVNHPNKPGAYLVGIECDGASYHSGRSARDRDRLRQEILENLGWKIYRVWSTDWFKSREMAIKKMLGHIQMLLFKEGG